MAETGDRNREGLGDLVDLIKAYARQETVDPLKGAGRWVGFVCSAVCS